MKKCPYCEEEIQGDAIKCRYCGEWLDRKKETLRSEKVSWKWKPKRWWLALIVFWLFSTIGAGILARLGQPEGAGTGFIIAIMMVFLIWCAIKDRSWKVPVRILYVIVAWIIHAILALPIGLAIIKGSIPVAPHLAGRLIALLAAFPIVIWAMRRSTFFVKPTPNKDL